MHNRFIQQLVLFVIAGYALLTGHQNALFSFEQEKPPQKSEPKKAKPPRISSQVVLISISGLRSDFANDPAAFRLHIPNIQSLRSEGSYAHGVESVYPSQSIPAHVTIATGVLPADHGITSDYAFDEQIGMQTEIAYRMAEEIRADTIWAAASREKVTTAAVGYPMTAHAAISFNLPDLSEVKNTPETNSYSNPPELTDEVLSALKSKSENFPIISKTDLIALQTDDVIRANAAIYLIEKHHPGLLLLNLKSLDMAQSRYGLFSKESVSALTLIDSLVGKIIAATINAGLKETTTFVIVSDHGSSKVDREFRPNVLLAKKGLLTVDGRGKIKTWRVVAQSFGGSAAIFINNPKDERAVKEMEEIFDKLEHDADNPLWRIISRRDAAKLGADPRPALFLDAAPTYCISGNAKGSVIAGTDTLAAYGYLPSRAEMRATLIISGQGIKANQRIEYARLIDVAPTIARLLGLEMKNVRGRVLTEVITQ
ncbi:MAG: alkaline phosphatase family protein [Blastocatellales bacterium]